MLEMIIGSLLYAKIIKKYRLKPVLKEWRMYLPLLTVLLSIAATILNLQSLRKTIIFSVICSFIPLIDKYSTYKEKWFKIGVITMFIGLGLNYIAVVSNNGLMPIFPDLTIFTGIVVFEFINDSVHVLGNFSTILIPFCDIIDTGFNIYSIGDILIMFIFSTMIYYPIKAIQNKYKIIKN